ncbi:hypothetical protein OIU84_025318 [Salix udensis]|uniref:Uncharacterized protein n=1 Tax=Salix udensis TaxID=889485 RepID=A0AAD6KKK2_9ROSI|nr:hypothetical protein OIU84_025318 [Salix udensis]
MHQLISESQLSQIKINSNNKSEHNNPCQLINMNNAKDLKDNVNTTISTD